MDRITQADVDRIAESVGEHLPDGLGVRVERRNGHTALDLTRGGGKGVVKTLYVGTKREIYIYLQGMRQAHLLERYGA